MGFKVLKMRLMFDVSTTQYVECVCSCVCFACFPQCAIDSVAIWTGMDIGNPYTPCIYVYIHSRILQYESRWCDCTAYKLLTHSDQFDLLIYIKPANTLTHLNSRQAIVNNSKWTNEKKKSIESKPNKHFGHWFFFIVFFRNIEIVLQCCSLSGCSRYGLTIRCFPLLLAACSMKHIDLTTFLLQKLIQMLMDFK